MSAQDVLDPNALSRLKEWGGDKLLGQMIRLFLENAPGRMEQIRGGLVGGDPREAEKGAHSLKSSAANIGAMRVRDLAAEVERSTSGGDSASGAHLLPPLEDAFAQAIAALEAVEKGLST